MLNEKTRVKLKNNSGQLLISLLRSALFILLAFVVFYPIFTKISFSFMTAEDVHDMSVNYIPKHFTLENFGLAWSRMKLSSVYPRTLLYAGGISLLQMLVTTVVGYGIARFKFPLAKPLMLMVILGLLIPPDMLAIPLYSIFVNFDLFGIVRLFNGGETASLLNTAFPMILLGITGTGIKCGLYIFMMRQFFRGMPKELEEAAYIDGAGPLRCFVSVIMPSSTTMLITVFLFSFVWTWLDRDYTSLFAPEVGFIVNSASAITSINFGSAVTDTVTYNLIINAGAIFVMLPLIILYVFTQKHFVQSVERSGLVG